MKSPFIKKRIILLCLLLFSMAHVDAKPKKKEKPLPFRTYVAPQVARLKFHVDDLGIYRGVTAGGSFGFEYRPLYWIYAGGFSEWMMGGVDSKDHMSRYIHDVDSQVRFGYTFAMWRCRAITFTPFTGLGFEYMVQHIREDFVVPDQKFRFYDYYIPVGIILNFDVTKMFSFRILMEWNPEINSRVKLPYVQGIRWDLNKEAGYLVEIPFNVAFGTPKVKAQIGAVPYLKRVVDGKLKSVLPSGATMTLPRADYKFWGFRLTLGVVY